MQILPFLALGLAVLTSDALAQELTDARMDQVTAGGVFELVADQLDGVTSAPVGPLQQHNVIGGTGILLEEFLSDMFQSGRADLSQYGVNNPPTVINTANNNPPTVINTANNNPPTVITVNNTANSNTPTGVTVSNTPTGVTVSNTPTGVTVSNTPTGVTVSNTPTGVTVSNTPTGVTVSNTPLGV
jgi:hypothetical protein